MKPVSLKSALSTAIKAARAAGKIMHANWHKPKHVNAAEAHDIRLELDVKCQALIEKILASAFPQIPVLAEEGSTGDVSAEYRWVIDPIDGTVNYFYGIPHFCISIAYVLNGEVELGVVYNPALEELYFARKGLGATRNGKPIRVADTRRYDAACVELGWSTRVPNATYLQVLSDILEQGANVRRAASGALALAYVADGRSDAYAELHMHPWDCLAGLLLVREAGGVTAPFLEVDGLAKGGAVLAAAPAIAEGISRATRIPFL